MTLQSSVPERMLKKYRRACFFEELQSLNLKERTCVTSNQHPSFSHTSEPTFPTRKVGSEVIFSPVWVGGGRGSARKEQRNNPSGENYAQEQHEGKSGRRSHGNNITPARADGPTPPG